MSRSGKLPSAGLDAARKPKPSGQGLMQWELDWQDWHNRLRDRPMEELYRADDLPLPPRGSIPDDQRKILEDMLRLQLQSEIRGRRSDTRWKQLEDRENWRMEKGYDLRDLGQQQSVDPALVSPPQKNFLQRLLGW